MNAKMDLAHVIKGLLSVECLFRLIGCVFTNSLRGAFLLWGWQPSSLIWAVDVLNRIVGKYRINEDENLLASYYNLSRAHLQPGNNNIPEDYHLSSNYSFLYPSIEMNICIENYSTVVNQKLTIESVCFLPSTLAVLGSYGIAIFVLLTGGLR